MIKSIAFAADASRLASLLLSYIPAVCAFVAPRHPGAAAAIIDRLSHSRALRSGVVHSDHAGFVLAEDWISFRMLRLESLASEGVA